MAAEAGKKKSEPLSPDEVTDLFRRLDDLLRQENYEQALKQARELCAEECGVEEEALSQGDLAGVLVQEAFLRDLQGRGEEASALYSRLLQKVAEERTAGEGPEEVDVAVLTVAQTNAFVHDARRRLTETGERSEDSSFARSGGCTLDDAIKRLARGTGQALDQKLTTAQALTLAVNRCVAFILAGRLEEARRLLAASSARFGPRQPKLILLRAALQLASGRPAKAEEQLRHLLSSSSPSSPSVSLPPAEEIRVNLALAALRLEQRILLLDSDEVEKQDVTACAPRKTKESRPSAGDAEAEKKKKKRKPRWPKGFDPNEPHLPPDPERWLPKCERTGYKKMLRRRKEAGRGGAQGAVAPGTAEATTGFRNAGPSTAKTEAAKDKNVGSRKKRGTRK